MSIYQSNSVPLVGDTSGGLESGRYTWGVIDGKSCSVSGSVIIAKQGKRNFKNIYMYIFTLLCLERLFGCCY